MDIIRKSSFYPVSSLKGKENFKEFITIHKEGGMTKNVLLNVVDPLERERLICMHYIRHLTRNFYKNNTGINIVSRDSPWDFKIQFSTGEMVNVEITSVANTREQFIINKSEERYLHWKTKEVIPLYELRKLNRLFPDPSVSKKLQSYKALEVSKNANVANPLYSNDINIFVSQRAEQNVSIVDAVKGAIDKKLQKKHAEKEKTILIIDNRITPFEVLDYQALVLELSEYCFGLPFPEIWFYIGYYSDNDGNNAEFCFSPLKATPTQWEILQRLVNSNHIDSTGKYFW